MYLLYSTLLSTELWHTKLYIIAVIRLHMCQISMKTPFTKHGDSTSAKHTTKKPIVSNNGWKQSWGSMSHKNVNVELIPVKTVLLCHIVLAGGVRICPMLWNKTQCDNWWMIRAMNLFIWPFLQQIAVELSWTTLSLYIYIYMNL